MEIDVIHNEDCFEGLNRIPSESIDLIVADPPYLTTEIDWDAKEIVSEDLSRGFFRVLKSSGNLYVWCGIGEKSQSLIRWFPYFAKHFIFKDLITWKKQRGIGMRKGWLYTREEIMWFVKDNKKFVWNRESQYSKEKRQNYGFANLKLKNYSPFKRLTNVWTDIKETNISWNKKEIKTPHYTPKPLRAIERIILIHTKPGDIVLDPFMGSGTTAVACKRLKRHYIGFEINSEYFEIAKKRLTEAQLELIK